ncbi:hypothetical protein CPB83DRAFT_876524 [Crepidotus variabilis]|uniref:DUF221-domain-containing protein n=1 Tax=Crepidotus variabilis TaxID=179855 RepID=A0A9P6EDZ0_9AGAR|nr:hypothetical protein CPB83DRAFT_876524 [Crepidotus variabilis]
MTMANGTFATLVLRRLIGDRDDGDENPLPPGSPPMLKFEGPWFQTQLTISLTIGIVSFFLFSYCRTRWPLLFAPRTKLKGFSPHEAHAHQAFFGWIMPTIRTSEFTVLQIVGLDAAVLLNFFKMSFYLFSVCSLFAMAILMPINWKHNRDIDDDDDWPGDNPDDDWPALLSSSFRLISSADPPVRTNETGRPDWLDLISDANSYLSVHLMFTYLFTLLSLYYIYKNYRRFIRSRQLFSLELVHSIPARTVLVTNLPGNLRAERTLAEYFENMGLAVESVTVCREVGSLKRLLDRRTKALLELEAAWTTYVGNPSTVEEYDPENMGGPLIDADIEGGGGAQRLVVPHRHRPTISPGWFKPKVDALEYLERQFKEADDLVKKKRRTGKFRSTGAAFVTFEKMSSAQIALQTAHSPSPATIQTFPAPEPRDIVWSNMTPSQSTLRVRDIVILLSMALLLFFWFFPITALASLLSYKEIKKAMPWLGRLIDSNERIRAVVQNSLPSVAMISLNSMLPFILEGLTYVQGYRARSWVEYSLLKKYFLFLLINVVFIFLLATTYWQLVRDLANSPAKVPEKLAQALQAGRARHFFLSYVILQGLGIMPLQLLNLGVIIPRVFYRMFLTRTPRDYAELNAPPMINYGVVYPQAILMFVITLLYSVVQPLIVIFGAIYFGVGYVVYKYKLLFVFYKPYESQGQAWPITFVRLIWGIIIFLLFMIGIFTLRQSYILSSLLVPLLLFTLVFSYFTHKSLSPLSQYVALSSVFEVQRGEEIEDVVRLREGHPVTWSQSHLSRRRYAQNDDTLYVAPEDERTDYSQPPMANWYNGVLNTGKRRYGHPALNGVLPEPWLPLKKGQTLVNHDHPRNGGANGFGLQNRSKDHGDQAVVLTLRKRYNSKTKRDRTHSGNWAGTPVGGGSAPNSNLPSNVASPIVEPGGIIDPWQDPSVLPSASGSTSTNATARPRPQTGRSRTLAHRLSYDHASGVIMLPDEAGWLDEGESDEEVEEDPDTDDYGAELERSVTESMLSEGIGGGSRLREGDSSTPGQPAGQNQPMTRLSRYGTYFHHPERRRQQQQPQNVPGAFPFPTATGT